MALTAPGNKHALLITGESGAGKTEATRAALAFLALHSSATDFLQDRLLRSTPVLEAFGNAHTQQNTNSSRFGKFIDVHFSAANQVVGATLQPYMLEASRVAGKLPEGERTYHIFYLLRAALGALRGSSVPAGNFWNRLGHAPDWIDLVHIGSAAMSTSSRLEVGPPEGQCLKQFEALHENLVLSGLKWTEVAECCRIVAAVALLADTGGKGDTVSSAAALLRIQESSLKTFLTKAEMSVGGRERLRRARSEREAATLRASFAQELYALLFGWLTRMVARGIAPPAGEEEAADGTRMLGLLDLYGFEVLSSNGFEQFLINYCNERLQQFFNREVLTIEAEEYTAEGLDTPGQWRMMMPACQLPALSLLEGEVGGSVGAFAVINDRSRCVYDNSANQAGFNLAEAIAASCGGHTAFRKPPLDSNRMFGIAHFAGEVFYEAEHFAWTNASAHRLDVVAFLRHYGGAFVSKVASRDRCTTEGEAPLGVATSISRVPSLEDGSPESRRKLFGQTLINVFRGELNELCSSLEARQCRRVRCLRPNDEQAPLVFDDASMLRQCRYSGLLEAMRIRREGYAYRRPLHTFAARFALLLGTREARSSARHASAANVSIACKSIRQAALASGILADDAVVGFTKVFLRESALAWFEAERIRVASSIIAAFLRGHWRRHHLARLCAAVLQVQSIVRGWIARRHTRQLREDTRAALERKAAETILAAAHVAAQQAAEEAESARVFVAACQIQRWWHVRSARPPSMVAGDAPLERTSPRVSPAGVATGFGDPSPGRRSFRLEEQRLSHRCRCAKSSAAAA